MLSKTIKEELQQKIEDKREERQWVINAIRKNESNVRKYMKLAKENSEAMDKKKKLVDTNDKQIKQLNKILDQMSKPANKK